MSETDHHHSHHHHHHHHSSGPLSGLKHSLRHMFRHIQKWQIIAALVIVVLLAGLSAWTVQKYQERKQAEAEIAAWRAANGLSGQEGAEGQYAAREGQNASDGLTDAQNGKDVDFGPLSNNTYSEQLALRRLQPFVNKEVLYNGKRYTRNTAVKAILLLGLDRSADDLQEIRPELWEQGQTGWNTGTRGG